MATMSASLTRSAFGPSLRHSASGRRCAAAKAPVSYVRTSRATPTTQAYWRGGRSWSGSDEAAMKAMVDNMARAAGVSGVFYYPGGSYTYGSNRCKPCGPSQHQHQQFEQQQAASAAGQSLSLDVVATDDFYLLYADVPGLAKADLSIKLSKERVLKIAGERQAPADWEGWTQKERRFGAFERQWQLPDDADSQGISAKVTEGVLTVTVPKKQPEPEVDESEDIAIN